MDSISTSALAPPDELGDLVLSPGMTEPGPARDPRLSVDRRDPGFPQKVTTGGLAGWQIKRVRAFIDEHLDQTIHVKDLSDLAQRSAAYFSRAFKRSFGEAPHAYLVRCRLDRAGYLMLASNAPLSEIALNCGFTDQAHLCKLFRQNIGQSPAAWRRERRGGRCVGANARVSSASA